MIRRMLILAAVALVAFAPMAAAQYQPGNGSASVSDSTVSRGQSVTVSASGCTAGSTVTFFFDGNSAGSATADSSGTASTGITIPSDASFGTHTITNSCNDAVLSITVVSGVAATSLPRTGSDHSLPLARIAIVLIAAGALLVVATRDRSKSKAGASA